MKSLSDIVVTSITTRISQKLKVRKHQTKYLICSLSGEQQDPPYRFSTLIQSYKVNIKKIAKLGSK